MCNNLTLPLRNRTTNLSAVCLAAAKHGILRYLRRIFIYDKGIIRLPWHSSFTTMQTFVKWGIVGQNKAEGLNNTTDLTTKGARLDD